MTLDDGGAYCFGFELAWAFVLLAERHDQASAFAALLVCAHTIIEIF
jgi:hypothetical protein